MVELLTPSLELLSYILENKDKLQQLNKEIEKCFVVVDANIEAEDQLTL